MSNKFLASLCFLIISDFVILEYAQGAHFKTISKNFLKSKNKPLRTQNKHKFMPQAFLIKLKFKRKIQDKLFYGQFRIRKLFDEK